MWAKYLKDRGIRHSITKRERDAYKAEVPPGGLKFRSKDILIERALTHKDPKTSQNMLAMQL
jgi:hypothetical protein